MFRSVVRAAYVGLFASVAIVTVLGSPVQADSTAHLDDTYWGGNNLYNNNTPNGDVIANPGDHSFDIASADITRIFTGSGTANLQVVIHTDYAAHPGADGTGFGSLFLGPAFTPSGTGPEYKLDTFVANPSRFTYVFTMPVSPGSKSGTDTINTSSGLIPLLRNGTDVQQSYYPVASQITNPPGALFRNDQAVLYKGSTLSILGGTWSFDDVTKTVKFLIENENGSLGTDFAIAWAMTCANDTILGNVHVDLPPSGGPPPVPLPAAFGLMGTVLFGTGGIFGWRKRRARSAA